MNQLSSIWLGIGFSNDQKMVLLQMNILLHQKQIKFLLKKGDDSVCMCKYALDDGVMSVEQYYNSDKITPSLLNKTLPTVGLSDIKVNTDNGYLICSFKREKRTQCRENILISTKNFI